jgi:pyruvate kinase
VLSCAEATLAGVARSAIDFSLDRDGDGVIDLSEGCVALVLTATGEAAELVAKYRPSVPVIVASTNPTALRQSCIRFGLHPLLVSAAAAVTLASVCLSSCGFPSLLWSALWLRWPYSAGGDCEWDGSC